MLGRRYRPRSYRGGVGGYLASPKTTVCATCFLRAYAGAPVTRTLRSSLLRCGERPCDTLRALPENVAAPRGSRWAHLYATSGGCVEVSVASVATSGCPKRSEGGCPCRSEEGAEPRANPAGWFVVWACAPCLANWCGGGLSPFSVLLGDLAFCMWRGGNMRRGSLHPHAMSHRVSECNPGESLA